MHGKGWNPGAAKDYDEFNFGLIKFSIAHMNATEMGLLPFLFSKVLNLVFFFAFSSYVPSRKS